MNHSHFFIPQKAYFPRIALRDHSGECSYNELVSLSTLAAGFLQKNLAPSPRVAVMVSPGREYVAWQWGIWKAGGMMVPLSSSYPPNDIEWFLKDALVSVLICDSLLMEKYSLAAENAEVRLLNTATLFSGESISGELEIAMDSPALMLYTSGTTGKPKGVPLTHLNISSQTRTLVAAWKWSDKDRILHSLPLHHTHGIVNALCCPLAAGACVEWMPVFDPDKTWDAFSSGRISVYMAVPTMYVRLLREWNQADEIRKKIWAEGAASLRLMVSGSAPLPVDVFEEWKKITGHSLLERYGMTETGMILSNPIDAERKPGTVGQVLPGVELILSPTESGDEIRVKGESVFKGYWNRPEANQDAFDENGFFKTGDIAVIEQGSYRLLGRASVDIIKSGGYKISAIETEEILRNNHLIQEIAVIGIPDTEWGERVAAIAVLIPGATLSLEKLREWCRDKMAAYRMPSAIHILNELPRNAMGKVDKKSLKKVFHQES